MTRSKQPHGDPLRSGTKRVNTRDNFHKRRVRQKSIVKNVQNQKKKESASRKLTGEQRIEELKIDPEMEQTNILCFTERRASSWTY